MAINFDAVSNAGSGSGFSTASTSWTHTCSGSNRALVVGVAWINGGSAAIQSVKYNGVSLTQMQNAGGGYDIWIGVLLNPSAGANTVQVTLNGAPTNAAWAAAMSFTGVRQSSVDSTGGQNFSTTTGPIGTCTVVTVAKNAWIVDVLCLKDNNGAWSANSPQISKYIGGPAFANPGMGFSYNGPIVTPGSTSDGWTDSSTGTYALGAFSLAPALPSSSWIGTSLAGGGPRHGNWADDE